ncbi:glycosyltransferase [Methylobacillus gramineus]|uniref:MBL fold metallo-hydrolase n=1 Tax=Methylobacillus gramineus TaxID=755169 RepID=UPI001CFFA382|nr:MBL fold metallo-hydrolase [Methylobacillus gramineus]MCB5185802.1 glycosyltransferase [Methylobacillus gramineus]
MTASLRVPVQMLGQSGCRLGFAGCTVYVDPYLSNSVQELDAPDLDRLLPIPILPEEVRDADWVLITHAHIDHCDPHTLPKLAAASPQARFVGPAPVIQLLAEWGIADDRLLLAEETWQALGATGLRLHAIPAAHPELVRDKAGNLACVGFVLEYAGQRLYVAGDTMVKQEIIDALARLAPLHTAFLPVNEHNFFRGRRGIIGNMSIREAFQFGQEIGVRQVVAVHWDMFSINAVDPDEIRLLHQKLNPGFDLLLRPTSINLGKVRASIIIRTLNEARHLESVLQSIASQTLNDWSHEVILVDSGSTDDTLQIAERYGCRIQHITREEFSFGRSLNRGCEAAMGDILVFISGHCVPTDAHWLQTLCQPILEQRADYAYGKQLGGEQSHFSEKRIFAKYFPAISALPQAGFFCNNANAALSRKAWQQYRFDEDLTGLEDMDLAQRLTRDHGRVGYIAEAAVYHHHDENWPQVRRRFEREAIALQRIMPQLHVGLLDTVRYILSSFFKDVRQAWRGGIKISILDVFCYRLNQYWGAYKGNHEHRRMSRAEKEKYFYPQ